MRQQRVLVVGAGASGSILAFWLAKYDFQVTVIERSRAEQKAGQGIEIEEPALSVVKKMGILDTLKARKTGEMGSDIVDESSRLYARFDVGSPSPTGELEIMRGDLTEILYKAADESNNVTYHFETTIQSLRQSADKVYVDLRNSHDKSTKSEEFDFVVGADGVNSKTRRLIMGADDELDCRKKVGAFIAWFSIPKQDQDWPNSRVCSFSNRRVVWIRPIGKDSETVSVYLIHLAKDVPAIRAANKAHDRQKQKEGFAELYGGLGWEVPRVLEEMMKAENFYGEELEQIKLPKWSSGRVALLGDSAWAPTPFTGQGNQLAIIGGWVLAQEMAKTRTPAAFENYETRLRKYVEECQEIPLGGYAPYLFCPSSNLGIWFLRGCFMALSGTVRFFTWANLGRFLPEKKEVAAGFDMQMESDGENEKIAANGKAS